MNNLNLCFHYGISYSISVLFSLYEEVYYFNKLSSGFGEKISDNGSLVRHSLPEIQKFSIETMYLVRLRLLEFSLHLQSDGYITVLTERFARSHCVCLEKFSLLELQNCEVIRSRKTKTMLFIFSDSEIKRGTRRLCTIPNISRVRLFLQLALVTVTS